MDDFIDIADITRGEAASILETAAEVKQSPHRFDDSLSNRTLLMLFEKPSTRTRVSFEAGMTGLGGHGIYFYREHSQMSRGEPVKDTARVLSGYCDAVMARMFDHDDIKELAAHASIPIINGLTDMLHPCQAFSDFFTMREQGFDLDEVTVTYLGDGNNMAHSLINAAALFGADIRVATPEGYEPDSGIVDAARERCRESGGSVELFDDPVDAIDGADVLYTDVWVSMGQEHGEEKLAAMNRFQVNEALLDHAADDAVFMHCLPAHRGQEVTDAVVEGDRSIVFDQAENRLYVQQAILLELLS